MQRAIEAHPVETYEPFELEVTLPGRLRRIVTGLQEPNRIIPAEMGKAPTAEMRPYPVLMFEIDPEKPKAKRKFIWMPAGVKLNFPGKLEYLDSYIDEPTGQPLFLYEVVKE
jgi:hypothetical protein